MHTIAAMTGQAFVNRCDALPQSTGDGNGSHGRLNECLNWLQAALTNGVAECFAQHSSALWRCRCRARSLLSGAQGRGAFGIFGFGAGALLELTHRQIPRCPGLHLFK